MLRNIDRTVKTGESWSAAAMLVHQLWSKVVPVMVATGGFGWVASKMEILSSQGWPAYIFVGLLGAFVLLGSASFVANLRYRWSASKAIAHGVRWSEAQYSPFSVIDGGTHTIAEIFGKDHVRSRVVFRNCTIEGPGVIGLFDSPIEKCDIAGVPVPVVIHIDDDFAQIGNFVPTAYKCQFINCTFFNVILVDQPFRQQSEATHLFSSIARLEKQRQQNMLEDKTTEQGNDEPEASPQVGQD